MKTVPISQYFDAFEPVSELDETDWSGYLEPVDQHTVRVNDLVTLQTMIWLNRL